MENHIQYTRKTYRIQTDTKGKGIKWSKKE